MSGTRPEDLSARQAQSGSTPAQTSDAKEKIKESQKTDKLNTGKEKGFQHEPPPQKPAECEKPSGKRTCKTKHLEGQETRKRSYLTKDNSCDTKNTEDTDAVPKKIMKKAGFPLHYASLSAKPYSQKQHNHLRKTILVSNPKYAVVQLSGPRQPMPREADSISVNKKAGETLLQRAAYLGILNVVSYCLKHKVCDIHNHDDSGYCALHEACLSGWPNIVRLLLRHGAHVNCTAQGGIGPIHDAVLNDYVDIVHLLLTHGADPMLPCSGMTIFQMIRSKPMGDLLVNYLSKLQF